MLIKILFFVVSFALADASDKSDKPCLGLDTAEAGVGGALIGYAIGSHPHALAVRVIVAGGGALMVKDSFDHDISKPACKTVAAVGGAAAGFANAKTPDTAPATPATPPAPLPDPQPFGPS